ncbi:MAG: biotin/lipoyl-binding protein, partial [Acidobacteria bacterium]|nr:biotin/lipoyl-binding protein [Acidobacteriota bacterium]
MTDSNESLDERLKSLRIDRTGQPASKRGVPKLALLAFSIVVVLIAGGALWFMSGPKPVDVAEAKRDTGGGAAAGETVLTASGYVIAAHRIAVGSKVLGRVAWIGVDKGDIVQQGQVLVRLEDSEFKAQVAQARGSLASAQARLDELRAGSRPQDKQMRRAAVAEAEATLREAELELERVDRLFKAGVAARAELDRAVARRDVARAQLDNARQSSSLT